MMDPIAAVAPASSASTVQVLLKESEQAHDAIHRFTAIIYGILGIVVPTVMGGLALVFTKDGVKPEYVPTVCLVLAAIYSVASLYAGALWIEVFGLLHFKYMHVMPLLYQDAGLLGKPNQAQSMAAYHTPQRWLPSIAFNLTSFLFVFTTSLWCSHHHIAIVIALLLLALITIATNTFVFNNMKAVYALIANAAPHTRR